MKNNNGFTLVELLIAITVIVLIALYAFSTTNNGNSVSIGITGITETRCINGYKFTVGNKGIATQIIDENGKGIKCK